MAKKNVIQLDFDSPSVVIGVASNDKVWKVCWNINQQLSLQLASAEDDVTRVKGPELYTDPDTDPDFEYYFFENTFKSSKVPQLARQFRYWLVIRPKKDLLPEVKTILRALAEIDNISLAHDLTQEKDIKKLLP
jgi:hypothetical protein